MKDRREVRNTLADVIGACAVDVVDGFRRRGFPAAAFAPNPPENFSGAFPDAECRETDDCSESIEREKRAAQRIKNSASSILKKNKLCKKIGYSP